MSFNGNKIWADYLANIKRSNAADKDKAIKEMNAKRLQRVEKARAARPVILPLQFSLRPSARVQPYTERTGRLNYPTDILGAITDLPEIATNIRDLTSESAWVSVGADPIQQASARDLAGTKEIGAHYYQIPFELQPGNRLTVDVFREVSTTDPDPTVYWWAFLGRRIYSQQADEAKLTPDERDTINRLINFRRVPEVRFLTMPVAFAGGVAATATPEQNEPLLIRGVRTGLANSTIVIRIEGEDAWMPSPAPIWALAAARTNTSERYSFFERPIYLPAHTALRASLVNTLGGAVDANSFITFLAETV
jgi:hypothetical protein